MRPLRIGITIGLRSADESLWVNGIKQNALFLALALKASPWRHEVLLVNTTAVDVSGALPWPRERFPTRALTEVIDELDVLIELASATGQLEDAQAVAWLRAAAEDGYPKAAQVLAEAYRTARGVAADPQQAQYWLARAAASGEPAAFKQAIAAGALSSQGR